MEVLHPCVHLGKCGIYNRRGGSIRSLLFSVPFDHCRSFASLELWFFGIHRTVLSTQPDWNRRSHDPIFPEPGYQRDLYPGILYRDDIHRNRSSEHGSGKILVPVYLPFGSPSGTRITVEHFRPQNRQGQMHRLRAVHDSMPNTGQSFPE